jgi:hypothetical protein
MASFNSILSDVGNWLRKAFQSPVLKDVETGIAVFAQTPLAALVLSPAGAALLSSSVTALENAETASILAGQQSGTGAQKAAMVAAAIEGAYNTFAKANNIPVTPASLQAFINSFVAVANSFPAATATTLTAAAVVVAPVPVPTRPAVPAAS